MRFTTTLALALGLISFHDAQAYYGRNSTEARLTYSASVEIEHEGSIDLDVINRRGRARNAVFTKVDAQIQHLMGTFQSESFVEGFGYPGVLGERYVVTFKRVRAGSSAGRKILDYDFSGTVVFHKAAFKRSAVRNVPLKLPAAPDRIYQLGMVRERGGERNACTDEHYDSEGDFWYFWDPDKSGCPLRGDDENVLRITGRLQRLPSTRTSYPEYGRLYGDNGNGRALDIAVFYGYLEDIESLRFPNRRDDAYAALRDTGRALEERGFELKQKLDSFREYSNGSRGRGINYLWTYEKQVEALGRDVTVRVKVMLADTSVSSDDATFHNHLVPSLENDDVVVYDGHSGLGGNLDLASLPDVDFDPSKYQLLFFNGCSSYPYFNGMFFRAKDGSRNLDVVTSGLPTYSDTAADNVVAFIQGFLGGETETYQAILSRLERSNGENGTYLTGVNGDEDNAWTPRGR